MQFKLVAGACFFGILGTVFAVSVGATASPRQIEDWSQCLIGHATSNVEVSPDDAVSQAFEACVGLEQAVVSAVDASGKAGMELSAKLRESVRPTVVDAARMSKAQFDREVSPEARKPIYPDTCAGILRDLEDNNKDLAWNFVTRLDSPSNLRNFDIIKFSSLQHAKSVANRARKRGCSVPRIIASEKMYLTQAQTCRRDLIQSEIDQKLGRIVGQPSSCIREKW